MQHALTAAGPCHPVVAKRCRAIDMLMSSPVKRHASQQFLLFTLEGELGIEMRNEEGRLRNCAERERRQSKEMR